MNSCKVARQIMRAIRVSQFGGPEVLKLEDKVPIPVPNDNQLLVKVYAAGVNPVDTYVRTGTYAIKPALPYTPGNDVAGIVESVGKGVQSFKEGDRVFAFRAASGGYAEFCVTDEEVTQPLSENLTFEQGASLGIPYYTAYRALVIQGQARPGETVLIHGASGAVGLACVQFACSRGLRIIGTAGSAPGIDLIKENGADFAFNHKSENYVQQIMDATNGEGPDLIIEMLANVNLEKDLAMVKKRGRIVNVGSRGSIEITPRYTMGKECTITGVMLMNSSPSDWKEAHAAIQSGMEAGWIKPHIGKEYSLAQAADAHNDVINNSGAQGKLVIKL